MPELIEHLASRIQNLLADATRFVMKPTQPGGKMADCATTPNCLFFNDKMAHMPSTAEMMKREYCRGITRISPASSL
jgi:hypothetical protein